MIFMTRRSFLGPRTTNPQWPNGNQRLPHPRSRSFESLMRWAAIRVHPRRAIRGKRQRTADDADYPDEGRTKLLLSVEPHRRERRICRKARDSAPQTGHSHRFLLMMKMAAPLAFFGR